GPYPHLIAWYERVQALGHGRPTPLSSEDALEVARRATSRAAASVLPGQAFETGAEVTVTPTDYAADPVPGRLVGLDADEVVIAREDKRVGQVQVHFPRIGYQVKSTAQA
ncbi:MAG TPA: glutathione S-transferase family protein, partial [Caldimonas sp.]